MEIICVGGGAASFFFAAEASRLQPAARISILEQGPQVLGKVKISGGGRCNVTHHCFDPVELITHYPRGGAEMLRPFQQFGPRETVAWFAERGVPLKTEADGRMFPTTDNSSTIIDCLTSECVRNGVQIRTRTKVKNVKPPADGTESFLVETLNDGPLYADVLFVAPGGSKQMWQVLGHLGHKIVDPVPSLFTFQINDTRLQGLAGVSVSEVAVQSGGLTTTGPLLITHKGLSGPAILRMSAEGARIFHAADYQFDLVIDFRPDLTTDEVREWRDRHGKKLVGNHQLLGLPKRLALRLLESAGIDPQRKLAGCSNADMDVLTQVLKQSIFHVTGQNRFKEEFVTAGGVDLSQVRFPDFSSKLFPGMFLAGEVLNIDAVTGGFNFQAAWTGAWHAARALSGLS